MNNLKKFCSILRFTYGIPWTTVPNVCSLTLQYLKENKDSRVSLGDIGIAVGVYNTRRMYTLMNHVEYLWSVKKIKVYLDGELVDSPVWTLIWVYTYQIANEQDILVA